MDFSSSRTYKNILNAYKGEIIGEYIYRVLGEKFLSMDKKEMNLFFIKLSNEEKGHANILKSYLEECDKYILTEDERQKIESSLVDIKESLKIFAKGEKEAGEVTYPNFSEIAKEEGYEKIAEVFLKLADMELKHGVMLEEKLATI